MKRFVLGLVCAISLLVAPSAQAAPILVPQTDTVIGTIFFDFPAFTPTYLGIQGFAGADVFDGSLVPTHTGLILVDPADTPPANTAFYSDLIDDFLVFDFDFSGSVFDLGAGFWALPVHGTAVLLADPALAPFVGTNLAFFSLFGDPTLVFDNEQQLIGAFANFSLDYIAAPDASVPEPATLTLIGTGLVFAARRRRKQQAGKA